MRVKVCGMRDSENMRQVAELGVDYIGMIFWEKSPRCVTTAPVNAGIIADSAPVLSVSGGKSAGMPKRVGVFVDEKPQNIIARVASFQLDVIQLHGHETPELIRSLRTALTPGIQLWKAISIGCRSDLEACKAYEDCVDAFLFDTKCACMGGSGKQFDWSVLAGYAGTTPFLLSGGIGPDDAPRLRQAFALDGFPADRCVGIDLNSRFETAPGMKDIAALCSFLVQWAP